ncbi:MAG: hypothetical protein WKF58_14330 [Ilumatobacteraceae bacterium]
MSRWRADVRHFVRDVTGDDHDIDVHVRNQTEHRPVTDYVDEHTLRLDRGELRLDVRQRPVPSRRDPRGGTKRHGRRAGRLAIRHEPATKAAGTVTWGDEHGYGAPGPPVLCDLDGVVWLSGVPLPGSPEAVAALRAAGRRVLFVTNNSWATVDQQEATLAEAGIPASGDVITSAAAAATLVQPGERVLVCGGPGVVAALEQRGDTGRPRRRRGRRCRRGRLPPRLRLRRDGRRRRRSAGRGASCRHQQRRHLSHAAWADPRRRCHRGRHRHRRRRRPRRRRQAARTNGCGRRRRDRPRPWSRCPT